VPDGLVVMPAIRAAGVTHVVATSMAMRFGPV
jgi:hypothetical protein